MGTPAFAVPVLVAVLDAGHDVVAVYAQPDRPSGRGKRSVPSPVKRFAEEAGLRVLQPPSLRPRGVQEELASRAPDVVVVAGYGLFLPSAVLDSPPMGCLNVHPSLLPKYRGPSPVASAILNGDPVTGVTIMKIDEGMDTGPTVARRETAVSPQENALDLTQRLFETGAGLLVELLPRWAGGEVQAEPQDGSEATVTRKLAKEDGQIDWNLGASQIVRQVLAYHPWPGSYTHWSGRRLKIVEASTTSMEEEAQSHGAVLSLPGAEMGIATGDGVLLVHRLQLEGRLAVSGQEFVRGYPDVLGSVLGP